MIQKIIVSIANAIAGIILTFKNELNFRIHTFFAFLILGLSVFLKLDSFEWIIIILCITLVIFAELFNTALEELCDKIEPEYDNIIKKVKDISAGATLILVIGSITIGLIIFAPKIWNLIRFLFITYSR